MDVNNLNVEKTEEERMEMMKETSETAIIAPTVQHTKSWNREFSSLQQQIDSLIQFVSTKTNVHGDIKKMANGLKATYSRLKRLDDGYQEVTLASKKAVGQQTSPGLALNSRVGDAKPQEKVDAVAGKRKDISPLNPDGRNVKKVKRRKKRPESDPAQDADVDLDIPVYDQEQQDPDWRKVVGKKQKTGRKGELNGIIGIFPSNYVTPMCE